MSLHQNPHVDTYKNVLMRYRQKGMSGHPRMTRATFDLKRSFPLLSLVGDGPSTFRTIADTLCYFTSGDEQNPVIEAARSYHQTERLLVENAGEDQKYRIEGWSVSSNPERQPDCFVIHCHHHNGERFLDGCITKMSGNLVNEVPVDIMTYAFILHLLAIRCGASVGTLTLQGDGFIRPEDQHRVDDYLSQHDGRRHFVVIDRHDNFDLSFTPMEENQNLLV